MLRDEDFTLEKLKIREDLTILMAEVRETNNCVKNLNTVVFGNGNPEKGHAFRLAKVEDSNKTREKHMAGILGAGGLIITGVITDWISRIFFHHK